MADDSDVLLKIYQEQWAEARQHENQRVMITNIVLIIATAIVGFIAQQGASPQMLPLAILLVVVGIFGAVACSKVSEAADSHLERVRFLHSRLDELHPNAQLKSLREKADAKHKSEYPKISKLHVYQLWLILHLIIILFGIVLTIITVT